MICVYTYGLCLYNVIVDQFLLIKIIDHNKCVEMD